MKRTFSLVILIVLLLVLCCSCAPVYIWEPDFQVFWDDFVSKYGGELEIVNVGMYEGGSFEGSLEGSIAGFFLFTKGEVSGSMSGQSETIIRFSWKSNETVPSYYISEISASKFRRVNGDGAITVNFELTYPEDKGPFTVNSELPIEYDAGRLSKMLPNEVISYFSKEVTVSMTDEQYAQFIQALSNAG